MAGPTPYMALAFILFVIGATGLLTRRNALIMFMSVELMLNAVNLTFVAAGRAIGSPNRRSRNSLGSPPVATRATATPMMGSMPRRPAKTP